MVGLAHRYLTGRSHAGVGAVLLLMLCPRGGIALAVRPTAPPSPDQAPAPCDTAALDSAAFPAALARVRAFAFEADRLSAARTLLAQHCLTAQQLQRRLALFQIEGTKLRLAQLAFPRIVDPAALEVIFSEFAFQ